MESEIYKGFKIDYYQDDFNLDPRTDFDNFGTMVCFHSRYLLGDKDHGIDKSNFESWEEVEAHIMKKAAVCLPLYLYDHSGLRIKIRSFNGLLPQGHAEFDSGQVGFIFITKEKLRKEFGIKRITKDVLEKAEENLYAEVETYDSYLTGNIYRYCITDEKGDNVDDCGGFIGDPEEYMLKECRAIIDGIIEKREKDKKKDQAEG